MNIQGQPGIYIWGIWDQYGQFSVMENRLGYFIRFRVFGHSFLWVHILPLLPWLQKCHYSTLRSSIWEDNIFKFHRTRSRITIPLKIIQFSHSWITEVLIFPLIIKQSKQAYIMTPDSAISRFLRCPGRFLSNIQEIICHRVT